jgi:hypothetical protein
VIFTKKRRERRRKEDASLIFFWKFWIRRETEEVDKIVRQRERI